MTDKTHSEELFEQFCDENELQCSRIPVADAISLKTPDYIMVCDGNTVIVEVKELGISPDDQARREKFISRGTTGVYDPKLDVRVRRMIDDAMPQLRRLARGKHPAIIVLHSGSSLLPVEGLEIRLAMYGKDIVEIGLTGDDLNPVPIVRHRFGGSEKLARRITPL